MLLILIRWPFIAWDLWFTNANTDEFLDFSTLTTSDNCGSVFILSCSSFPDLLNHCFAPRTVMRTKLENSQSLMTNEYTGSLPSPSTEKFSAVWVPSKSFTQMGAKLDPKVCITRWIFETHPLPPYNLSILGSLTLLLINTTAIRHLSSF